MTFDPDKYISDKKGSNGSGFDPDAYLASKQDETWLETGIRWGGDAVDWAGDKLVDAGNAISEAYTGEQRTTDSSRALPELQSSGLLSGENKAKVAAISPVLLTTTNPEEQAQIIVDNFPHIGIIHDEKGNVILENPKNNVVAMVNKPGMSQADVLQGGALAAEYTPAARTAKVGGSALGNMLRVGGASGATETANQLAQSAAGGEFNFSDVGMATGGGAAFEGIFTGLAKYFPVFREKLKETGNKVTAEIRTAFKMEARMKGINPDDVTDDVILKHLDPENVSKEEVEFGVELTKGGRTGNQQQIRLEDDMVSGRAGPKNQEVMLQNRAKQNQQVTESTDSMRASLGGDDLTQQQTGAVMKEGVREAERVADEAVNAAYEGVGDAALKPDAFISLFDATKKAIANRVKYPRIPGQKGTPGTEALVARLNESIKFFKRGGVKLKPQHIKHIESIRKSINGYIDTAANATDKRNMLAMKHAFDDYLDDAVRNAFFEGDDDALRALKSSRDLFSRYSKMFREQTKTTKSGRKIPDPEGKFIEMVVEGDPTDMQTVNTLFGAGNAFGKDTSVRLAQRIKSIVGEGEVWNAIRQAGFKRFLRYDPNSNIINPKRTLTAFNDAMRKNPELMRELFSEAEINLMGRYFRHIVKTRPEAVKGTMNPSGSGTVSIIEARNALTKLGQMLGFASGDPTISITGSLIQKASSPGKGAAEEAVRPFSKVINPRPELVGGGAALPMVGTD